jgi:hypothetical protein
MPILYIAGAEIEPTTSHAENANPLVHQARRRASNFSNLLQIESQKGNVFKNPATEQRSSAQGCTVRARAAPDRAR